MVDDKDKTVAPRGAPEAKDMPRRRHEPSDAERRMQDVLEDDDVRESLKELHAHAAKSATNSGEA